MDYITRSVEKKIQERLFTGKAIIIYGPRQSGKTTMVRHLLEEYQNDTLWLNGDNYDVKNELENMNAIKWKRIIGNKRIVVIDEAQKISNIGLYIKILIDEMPDVQVIATGSSSFELANKTAEPLTGRKFEYTLLPFSFAELVAHHGLIDEKRYLEQRLLYGAYPEIVNHPGDEQPRLSPLASSYLYRDLLMLDEIKKSSILDKLIHALALQIGSEVKSSELSSLLGVDRKTIEKYIDLLERSFVVFSLNSFSNNLRNEIKKGRKIYFYDLGMRNAILGNFVPTSSRSDFGGLWENYLILERLKMHCNHPFPPQRYFWRTTGQEGKEVDYIEKSSTGLYAWEFKANPKSKAKIPLSFKNSYSEAITAITTPSNYDELLLSNEL